MKSGGKNSANIFMPSPLSQRLRVAKKGQTLTHKKKKLPMDGQLPLDLVFSRSQELTWQALHLRFSSP